MAALNDFILTLNALVCFLIVLRLAAYKRNGAHYRLIVSICAWLLMVSCGSVTIFVLTGVYRNASIPETAINLAMLVAVWSARGNITRLASSLRSKQ